jgi:DNA-directed RNA polymerase specialized sigma24 family protein|tara:strand:- start:9180 stop:9635 length:456 start_codon:yes stop_codon:yes gene_type:complete
MYTANRNEIIEQHYRTNRLKLVKRYGGGANAEDIVQQAYTNALSYWTEDIDNFDHWFNTLLSNANKKFHIAEKQHGMVHQEDIMLPQSDPLVHAMTAEVVDCITNHRYAHILRPFFVHGFTSKEVADQVPEKHANVRVIIHRFKQEMKKKF